MNLLSWPASEFLKAKQPPPPSLAPLLHLNPQLSVSFYLQKATELSKQPVQAQPAPQADVPQQPAGGGGAVQPEAKPQPAETQVEQPAPPKEPLAEAV